MTTETTTTTGRDPHEPTVTYETTSLGYRAKASCTCGRFRLGYASTRGKAMDLARLRLRIACARTGETAHEALDGDEGRR